MSDMLDGVVAFSSREQAERFVGKMMDEDSASNMDVSDLPVPCYNVLRECTVASSTQRLIGLCL